MSKYDFGFGVDGRTWKSDPDYKSWMNTPNQLVDVKKRSIKPSSSSDQKKAAAYVASKAKGDGPSNAMRMSTADYNKAMQMAGISDYQVFSDMLADYGVLGQKGEFVGNVGQGSGRVFGGGSSGGGLIGNNQQSNTSPSAANQLDSILAANSSLMQRAATQGAQVANSRGLLNSSMAAEAAQGAMIDRATPLAQQDAQYWQNRGINEQQYGFQRGLNEQQFGFQSSLSDQQYEQQRGLNEQQYGNQRGLNEQGYQFDMGRMQQQFNNEMQRMGYAYELDQRNVPQNYAANISAQTLQNVQAIQADPNLEPAAKQAAIKNAIDMANANMSWAETFYNTPMPALRTPGAA